MDTLDLEIVDRFERSIINEDNDWGSSYPFLYDLVVTHAAERSLTVEWLPYRVQTLDGRFTVQKVIFGTCAPNDEPNYLTIAEVKLPLLDECAYEGYGVGCKIEVLRRIPHEGEVLRARHMPQDPFVIATKTDSSEVHIFDYKNHPARPPIGGTCRPDLRLIGHHDPEGFGLSWSTLNRGFLLSGSSDAKICLWDIDQTPLNKARINPLLTFEAHQGTIEDVAWHLNHCHLFGSCGVDQYLRLYDLRSPCYTSPAQSLIAHRSAVNCLSFNPFNEWLVATGSDDKTVKFFDLRKLVRPLHTFDNHNDLLVRVEWSPHRENILASSCCDQRVMIWDTRGIGREQSEEDLRGGTPELLHIHAGHTAAVGDISWNPTEDGMIASVSDESADYTLQVWKMADYIYSDYKYNRCTLKGQLILGLC